MTIVVTVRIAATPEQVRRADELCPGLYEQIIELARRHGLLSHRRVYSDTAVLDIDEWESAEGREAFRAVALPLVQRLGEARGTGPSTSETWRPDPPDA